MRATSVLVAAMLAVWGLTGAWAVAGAPPAESSTYWEPPSLPRYLTPEEQDLPLPPVTRDRPPPTGAIYCPPEYAPMQGLIISWEGYTDILTQLAVGVTAYDPNNIIWVVVDTVSEQTSVTSTLTSAGADMSRVRFVVRTTDTVWVRDYGPRYIFEDDHLAIIDHTYNRPRPNDNALNDYLSALWGQPQYDIPLTHGGGNFHLFANGDAFMTTLIQTENPSLTAPQIIDLYHQYQNVNLTIYPGFPTSFDSTQHIDMWMLPLGDYKVIVGQYAASTGQPYTITENAVTDLQSRGYTVYRTPGWSSGGTHYTYTNAVIIDDDVFISRFNVAQDATALAVYQAALPGYSIHQVDNSSIITAAGAMHCIVMHVPELPDPGPTVTVDAPNGGELWLIGQTREIRWTAVDDVGVTSVDILLSTNGGATYPTTIATGLTNTGTYNWRVPALTSTTCRIRVVAHDGDGYTGQDSSDADFAIGPVGPHAVIRYPLDTSPGWSVQGEWAFGQPTGQGGAHGNPDPAAGATGLNVYGVNLNGDYSPTSGASYYLTSGPLNLTGAMRTSLKFKRWLNTDFQPYAYAWIHVSNNGTTWTQVWANGASAITDGAWTTQEYDVAAVADNQATVYLRWGYRVNSGAWAYSGWNLDDVELLAQTAAPPVCRGDCNCDGSVGFMDIDFFVRAIPNNWNAWAGNFPGGPPCSFENCDVNGNGNVGFDDIDPFVGKIPSPCR